MKYDSTELPVSVVRFASTYIIDVNCFKLVTRLTLTICNNLSLLKA